MLESNARELPHTHTRSRRSWPRGLPAGPPSQGGGPAHCDHVAGCPDAGAGTAVGPLPAVVGAVVSAQKLEAEGCLHPKFRYPLGLTGDGPD